MSLGSLLSIARSALLAHQRAMAVTAHNIANAQTPGFSRQRLDLQAATPLLVGGVGTIGRGVTDAGIGRARDRFLDAAVRRDSGFLGGSSSLAYYLGEVESVMHEPSDLGIAASLDGLFQAFADLANDPSSGPPRELVRQAATRLVQQLRRLDSQLVAITADTGTRLRGEVDEANSLAQRIAVLNSEILASGGAAHSAPDLEDQRDLLIDKLSALMSVRALQRDDGTVSVIAGDVMLVDEGRAQQLEARALPGGAYTVALAGGGATITPGSGSLQALVDLGTTKLPAIRAQLDLFTKTVVTEVNEIHRLGYAPDGSTGNDFFDPTGTTAGTIALTAAIAGSGTAIAAGGTAAPGDGNIALRLAGLASAGIGAIAGRSLREFYVEIAAGVGIEVEHAFQDTEVQQALVDQAELHRSSVSGVSVEEEMVALISQQQAYSAAARIIRVADEMMQDLLRTI